MARFSTKSEYNLKTCDTRLQTVLNEAIKYTDFSVICGHRKKAEQDKAFADGKSKLQFPQSKHNKEPSLAVDICPYPIDWNDRERFYFLAGIIMGISKVMGVPIRWGGDWDGDGNFKDQLFIDLPHFEIKE